MSPRRATVKNLGPHDQSPMAAPAQAAAVPFESAFARTAKRLVDLTIVIPLLLILLPLVVVIAAAIKCMSRGPVLYSQMRLGHDGKPFRIWKFRTMVIDADRQLDEFLEYPSKREEWILRFKLKDDPRVIPGIGHLLRSSGLDELPQLWNVLLGEMSLVGPRPLPLYHLDQFEEPFRHLRASMPPGITGQWQVSGRDDGDLETFRKWDTHYILNWSIWLDLQILSRTPWVLLSAKK